MREINASNGNVSAMVTGGVELDQKVLVIRRIHAHYTVRAPVSQRETIERVQQTHADYCPVARSLRGAIDIQTSFELID